MRAGRCNDRWRWYRSCTEEGARTCWWCRTAHVRLSGLESNAKRGMRTGKAVRGLAGGGAQGRKSGVRRGRAWDERGTPCFLQTLKAALRGAPPAVDMTAHCCARLRPVVRQPALPATHPTASGRRLSAHGRVSRPACHGLLYFFLLFGPVALVLASPLIVVHVYQSSHIVRSWVPPSLDQLFGSS